MRGAVQVLLVALVLAACGGESAGTTTTSLDGDTTTTERATTTTEQATTTTSGATTTTTAAATSSGGDDCLVGEWELDSESFMENLSTAFAAEAETEGLIVEFVGGTYTVTLGEDGTFDAVRDEWAFQMVSPEGTIRLTVDGVDQGMWSTSDSSLTIDQVESTTTITAQAVVDGEVVDLPIGAAPTVNSNALAESSSFACTDQRLTVAVEEGFVSELTRVGG